LFGDLQGVKRKIIIMLALFIIRQIDIRYIKLIKKNTDGEIIKPISPFAIEKQSLDIALSLTP
jgi:hypothetical protein